MRRFFLVFLGLQILLFWIELLQPVQQHVVLPWTARLAELCVALVTRFDTNAAAMGKVARHWRALLARLGVRNFS